MSEWVKWYGGKCPMPLDAYVDVQTKEGVLEKVPASDLVWQQRGIIIAYRVSDFETQIKTSLLKSAAERERDLRLAVDNIRVLAEIYADLPHYAHDALNVIAEIAEMALRS